MLLSRTGSYGKVGQFPTSVGNFSGQTFNINTSGADTWIQFMNKVGDNFFYTIEPSQTSFNGPKGTITMTTGLDIVSSVNYTNSGTNYYAIMNQVDSNGDYYGILTRNYSLSSSALPATQNFFPAKFNSNGNVILATDFTISGQNLSTSKKFFSSSDSLYFTQSCGTSGNVGATITKIDNTFNVTYSKQYNYGTTFLITRIYTGTSGTYSLGNNDSYTFIMKTDSNGNHVWTVRASATTTSYNFYDIVENNNNLYVVGYAGNSGTLFVKLDTNGNILFRKTLTGTLYNYYGTRIMTFNDHILFVGDSGNSGGGIFMGEIDGSCNIIWARYFTSTATPTPKLFVGYNINGDSLVHDGKFILAMYGFTASNKPALIFNFPTNGTQPFSGNLYISGIGSNVMSANLQYTSSNVSFTTTSIVPTVTSPTVTSSNVTSQFTKVSVPTSTWNYVKY